MGGGKCWILGTIPKEIGLCLSGGAARGAYHLGVLKALGELGIGVRAISGSSIGAAIGVGYACGNAPEAMLAFFKSRAFRKSIAWNFWGGSVWKIDATHPVFEGFFQGYTRLEDLPLPLYVSVCDLQKGEAVYAQRGDLRQLLEATCALAPFFPFRSITGRWYGDGGFVDNLPLHPLKQSDLPLVAVNLHPRVKHESSRGLLRRALFLCWHANVHIQEKEATWLITSPELSRFSLFSFSSLDVLMEMGYVACLETFDKLASGDAV